MVRKFYGLFFICIFSLSFLNTVFAQEYNSSNLERRKWRVSLFPPLSTNGTQAPNYTAKYSINLLVGYNGGLDGYEFGGLVNYNKYYADGLMFAGVGNMSGGDMNGVNFAGVYNYAGDDIAGLQFAGLANIADGALEGFTVAGLLNSSKQGSAGFQVAGLANLSQSDIQGFQAAGLFNYAGDDLSGLQAAGLFNYAGDAVEGLQAAGLFNFAGDGISGLQAAGFANISGGSVEGLVASGFINYAKDDVSGLVAAGGFNIGNTVQGLTAAGIANIASDMQGLQFAAFNVSESSQGLQVGIINFAKEFEGAPVGLLSIYGNGRKNVDFRISDAGFTEIGITTGTYRVYNMLILGYNPYLDRDVYRVGLAIGLEKNIQDSFESISSSTLFVNQEFAWNHHFEGDWSTTKNRILSYKFMVGNRFAQGFSIYGGPSINMQVTRVDEANDYTWWSFWSPERKGKDYRFWIGFTAGIRLFKQKDLPLIDNNWNGWGEWNDW